MEHALIKFKFLVLDFSKNGKISLVLLILKVIQLWCAWYGVIMSMNGVPRMMVWLMSFVTTKNVLREMPLLKTEAWVFPAICNLELLAVKSFSEVFCKNLFGTMPSLIQFKSAPVSNKTIVSSLKSSEKTRVILIKYFLEDIWVSMFKKSSGICSIFVSVCGNAWDSMVWSSVSDWLSILDRRCCNMVESFC